MKKKLLITSILSVIMCISLIVGATFALFTSQDEVNIAVTSGEVKIEAKIANTEYKTLTQDWTAFSGTADLDVGGSIAVKDNGEITFDKVVPGDGVKLDILIDNSSNVSVKYRVIISAKNDNGLFKGLEVTVDNQKFLGQKYSEWKMLDAEVDGETIALKIELPESAGNKYQVKECDILVSVEAVQGNAKTFNDTSIGTLVESETVSDGTNTISTTISNTTMSSSGFTAEVPAGVILENDVEYLTFNVLEVENPTLSNFKIEGVDTVGLDIDIPEVSEDNNQVIKITLEKIVPVGTSAINILHRDVPMVAVNALTDLTSENQFYLDSTTGNVTLLTKNFSEFVMVLSDELEVSGLEGLKLALNNGVKKVKINDLKVSEPLKINTSIAINGNGKTIERAEGFTGAVIEVGNGVTLTLSNVIIDGGAIWTGEKHAVLDRGIVNSNNVKATGALVALGSNSHVVLNEGAILQNNDGANAVNLGTRVGSTLTINGGEILNNHSAAGAIWGGGAITINYGKVNGNHGGIGGAIRAVTNIGTILTMNGGEMNHNYSDDVGGAIWAGSSKSNNVYVLNGGEMAYNGSPKAGGAIYAGYCETVKISGTFKMHDNTAPSFGAIRFHNHASLIMTGGEIYNNGENSLFLNNNSASITGGYIADNFGYNGGLGLTWGNAEVDGVITYNLQTNHNTAYLAKEFNTLNFKVTENDSNFAYFNFKPAEGYVYSEGDEDKLICLNEGYEVYYDVASGLFKLQTK